MVPKRPTVRLFVMATVAGALEPCGCQKDMLGGVDHAAALVAKGSQEAKGTLVVGAGPMFFMDPKPHQERKTQDLWKAEALAQSYKELGLVAWAPGFNDWAQGAATLNKLKEQSGAALLGANLSGQTAGASASVVREVGGVKVALVGAGKPSHLGAAPEGVTTQEVEGSLAKAVKDARAQGAQVVVALVALERGEALRVAERVKGLNLLVVGKPYDQGEGNDKPTEPALVGGTLVVQTPNHLQAVSQIDLYVRGDSFEFQDASGIAAAEERTSLKARIAELQKRISEWEKSGKVKQADLQARKADLAKLEAKLKGLSTPEPPAKGSFFRYDLAEVRESLGKEQSVADRMLSFYKRVNDHNKEAFKDRKPPALEAGKAGYIGVAKCASCHTEEHNFYKTTSHARAYLTLEKDHKEFNLDCVGCHVTGYEKPGGSTVTHVDGLKDVQCETCHGPGSLHAEKPEKPGLITLTPSRTLCSSSCHHPPHVNEDWDVNQAWSKIIGKGHGM